MREISHSKKENVIQCLSNGLTTREASFRTGVSKSSVARIGKNHIPDREKKNPGRKNKVTKTTIDYMVRLVTANGVESVNEVSRLLSSRLGISISDRSVRRYLSSRGIERYKKPVKPYLSSVNRKKRLLFAKTHIDWTDMDWKDVVWSDETKINRFGSDGAHWCYKRVTENVRPSQVRQTIKHGGGSFKIWSCITWAGVDYLVFIEDNLDKELYKQILEEDLTETLSYYSINSKDITFMHDNDPKHSSKLVAQWLKDQPFETMTWPAQSPDLNPIENVWKMLKSRLYSRYERPPASMKEHKQRIIDIWYGITAEEIKPFMLSMNNRCTEVIKKKGYWIDY